MDWMETKVKIEESSPTQEEEYDRKGNRSLMEGLQAVGTTSSIDIGWPLELTMYKYNGDIYFGVQEILQEFYLKKHVEKNGYKAIDKLLEEQGESEPFVCRTVKCRERLLVRHSAAVTILLMFKHKAGKNAERMKILRRHILQNVVPLSINSTTKKTFEAQETPYQLTTTHTYSLTSLLASATEEASEIATNQQNPWQSVTPRLTDGLQQTPRSLALTLRTHRGGTPFPTRQLIRAKNLRNEFKKGRSKTRTRALDSRIKKHNSAFKKVAEEIHYGSKEDLIAGIVETASKKSKKSNAANWDGSLSFEDILVIARRLQDPKTKKSLCDILTSEQSTKEND